MTLRRVLVEMSVTEQRYRAVLDVQAGLPVVKWRTGSGFPGKPSIGGCAGMPISAWKASRTGLTGPVPSGSDRT